MPLNNTQMLTTPKFIFSAHIYPIPRLMDPAHCPLDISIGMSNTRLKISQHPHPTAAPPQPPPVGEFPSVQILGPKPSHHSGRLLLSPVLHPAISKPDLLSSPTPAPSTSLCVPPSALCPLLRPRYRHSSQDSARAVAGQSVVGVDFHCLDLPTVRLFLLSHSPSHGHRCLPTPCASSGATHLIPGGLWGGTHRPDHRSTECWPMGGHLSPEP